jgi:Domain of unknown function (DUF5122) beta-propeller
VSEKWLPALTRRPTPSNCHSFHGEIRAAAVLPNGKILIGGHFTIYVNGMGDERYNLARLQSDGSPDTDFYNTLGQEGTVNALGVQTDGKIVVGGYSLTVTVNPPDTNTYQLARINVDGSPDQGYQ